MALANTTFGVIMATIDSSIMLIALPDIFQGIHLDPLRAGNSFYLLWMILSFLVVSSVLVVSFGRLGDMFGRVKMYNLGFAIYTLTSLILTVDWMHGQAGALYLVVGRVFQGVGAAFLVANSSAILTDAFPEDQRGLALGINNVAAISGVFVGLVLGRDPRADRLAPGVPGLRAVRAGRDPVGLLQVARNVQTQGGGHRLAREHHLRHRSDRDHDRHHVRDPALRRPHDGLDEPDCAQRAGHRGRLPGCVRRHRTD